MVKTESPQVSVVIPCYNAAAFISETLTSVYAQEGVELETIVVDDGSTDESAHIIRKQFPQVQLIQTLNQGPSKARNIGTYAASGTFIQYLDADDLLEPGKLAKQATLLQESKADVAYGNWRKLVLQPDGHYLETEIVARQITEPAEIALFTDFWCPPAAYLFYYRIVEKVGGWNERLPIIQDARFALDCALQGGRFVYLPEVVASYRKHEEDSVSTRDACAFRQDCLRNAEDIQKLWESGELTNLRRRALIKVYSGIARGSYGNDASSFETAYAMLQRLQPGYKPTSPRPLAFLSHLIGYRKAEQIAFYWRRIKLRIRSL